MNCHKLRIAWSVTWGAAAVLLIALWVRSYWVTDVISRIDSRSIATTIGSQYGAVYFAHFDAQIGYRYSESSPAPRPWGYKALKGYIANNGLFVWNRDATSLYVALPHWAISGTSLVIGGLPWLPWWSKRFSLRTLLIATTLVAVAMGLIAWLR